MGRKTIRAVQLFAGTGTMTRAFQKQGVEIVLAQEPRRLPAQVYRTNFPEVPLVEASIEKMQMSQFPKYELLLAQIPIASFSVANRTRNFSSQVSFITEILSVVRETKPKAFCFSVFGGNQYRDMCREQLFMPLSGEGYHVMFRVLSGAEFGGVPFAGKAIYAIGCRTELMGKNFHLPEQIKARALGPWYLQAEANEKVFSRRIPEAVTELIPKENAKPGDIYRLQHRLEKERAEQGEAYQYQLIECECCPRLNRRVWYDTYVQTERGVRRLTWKEYLTLQEDKETIFPVEMSAAQIWECMEAHGMYPVEYRVAEQLVKALRQNLEADEDIYADHGPELPEYIAAQFLKQIPDFTDSLTDKHLGMLRMPVGIGSIHCTESVAQELLKRTSAKWKIVVLCPYLQLKYQLEQEMEQYALAVCIQRVEELKRYMAKAGGGIFIATYAQWEQYTEQLAGQNHNGICLICYEPEPRLSSLRHTPKCLPQAYYIGISNRSGTALSEELLEWFGEVKYEYRMTEAMRDILTVPLYREVLHPEQNDGIIADAEVKRVFAAEVFKDNLLTDEEERALVVLGNRVAADEFRRDLLRLKNVCLENLRAAAEEFGLQSEVLRERLEKSDYFLLTIGERSTYREQTLQKFKKGRRVILITVSMWQGVDILEASTAYVLGQINYYELAGIISRIARPYEGKSRARIVFCGCSQPEPLKEYAITALPEMQKLVQKLWNGDYSEGYQSLEQLKKVTGIMGRTVEQELRFLYPAECRQEDLQKLWQEHTEELRVLCAVWCLTSQYGGDVGEELLNSACCACSMTEEVPDAPEEQEEETEIQRVPGKEFASSYEQGAFLEEAVMELLRQLFLLDESYAEELESRVKLVLDTLRRQKSGAQGGYDIRVVYLDASGKKRVCLFECKNKHVTEITVADIAGKLEQVKSIESDVEHWILIAPGAKLANDVDPYLERMEKHPGSQLPVRDVQVWTEENRVRELFGLVPGLYHEIYGQDAGDEDTPEGWSGLRRRQVLEQWKHKLLPVALLPQAFLDYPEKTEQLLFDVSNDSNLRMHYEGLYSYERYVKLCYFDDEGRYIDRYLEEDLEKWLFQKGHRVKVLLGEFGDGKTFFLYSFGRRLLKKFRENPAENYLPICFSLKRMKDIGNVSEFINERLQQLGATRADFLELKQKYHVLVCLDGLDEMSAEMDNISLIRNAKLLIKCCDELRDAKILITSRRQCFMSGDTRNMLREGLGGFGVWQLAHVTEEDVRKHLYPMLQKAENGQGSAAAISENHKWMALAGKPLFFEMLQDLLADNVSVSGSENAIYDAYIHKCLLRKFDESFERSDMWVKRDETIERIYQALEEMAVKMQMKGQERLRINELPSFLDESLAEILWKDKEADERTTEDAKNRFSMRLLFKSEGVEEIAFAHRSIREYFVGKYLLNLLMETPEEFLHFIEQYACNYEVLGFLAEGIKEEAQETLVEELISFLPECRTRESAAAAKILQICFLVDTKIPKAEWSGQKLDGVYIPGADFSGQDLSHSWIRNANLNNVRLDDADCSYCDFTGSRLEETKNVEAIRQRGQQLRVIYADGLVRDWEPERAESQVCWTGQSRLEKACLLERGWLICKEQGQRELFLQEEQIKSALHYWDREKAEVLDAAGTVILLTVQLGQDEYLTAAVDCMKREVKSYCKTDRKAAGRLCGEMTTVISDGERVYIFDRKRKQEYCFPIQADGLKQLAARKETDNYQLAVLAEGRLILVSFQRGDGAVKKKEYLLPVEGINHIALMHGSQIALGSYSGNVFLAPVNWETLDVNWECRRELQLGIYCRNVKTEGLIPEEIKRSLEMHR